jgi:hypothetical protein
MKNYLPKDVDRAFHQKFENNFLFDEKSIRQETERIKAENRLEGKGVEGGL